MNPRLQLTQEIAGAGDLIAPAAVKAELRLNDDTGDERIKRLLGEAVAYVEGRTGLALAKADWTATYERFPPDGAPLVFPGLGAEKAILTYGAAKTTLTVTGLQSHPRGDLEIRPASGPWPARADPWSIVVTGTRGVEASKLPGDLQSAVLLQWAQLHDGQDPDRARGVEDFCYRYWPV